MRPKQGLKYLSPLLILRQWGVWNLGEPDENGKRRKMPLSVPGFTPASSTNSECWCDSKTALRCLYERTEPEMLELVGDHGLAYFFCKDDPYFCIDLDDAWNGTQMSDFAQNIVDKLGAKTYIEVSQSGKGLHIIGIGKKNIDRCRTGEFECYDNARFLAITGDTLPEYSVVPAECQNGLDNILSEMFPAKIQQVEAKPVKQITTGCCDMSPDAVLQRMFKSKNGHKLEQIYYHGCIDTEDASSVDLAFCNALAFWCRKDTALMDTIIRHSALMREKWDKYRGANTYGDITINRAIADCTNVWEPQQEIDCSEIYNAIASGEMARVLGGEKETADVSLAADQEENAESDKQFANMVLPKISEMKMAMYVLSKIKKHWLYNKNSGLFFKYNDGIWSQSNIKSEYWNIVSVFPKLIDWRNVDKKKPYEDALTKLESERFANAVVSIIPSLDNETLAVNEEMFDTRKDLLPFKNCVVDLKTGEQLKHNPEYMFTMKLNYNYNPEQTCPQFLNFLMNAVPDTNNRGYLLDYLGYCLTGETSEERIINLYGHGGTGKSTLLKLLSAILAPFTAFPSTDIFKDSNNSDVRKMVGLAALKGKRLGVMSEISPFFKVDEGLFKRFVGGDQVTATKMRKEQYEFTPTAKIIIASNDPMQFHNFDPSLQRRVTVVEMDKQFIAATEYERKQNNGEDVSNYRIKSEDNILDILKSEAEGILALLVMKAKQYYDIGKVVVPVEVTKQTAETYEQNDIQQEFIDTCIIKRANGRLTNAEISTTYKAFLEAVGIDPIVNEVALKRVGRCIRERLNVKQKKSNGRYYPGYVINIDWKKQLG